MRTPLLTRALAFAVEAHAGQLRKDGRTPYVVHPGGVLRLLSTHLGVEDPEVLVAAALHDVLEDTPTAPQAIRSAFGPRVLGWVEELTLPPEVHGPRVATEVKTRHLVAALGGMSWEAVLVKLCDRTDNLSDVAAAPWPAEKVRGCRLQSPERLRAVEERRKGTGEPPALTSPLHAGMARLEDAILEAKRRAEKG